MKILVVHGNKEILLRTKQIFDRYGCHYSDSIESAQFYDLVFSLHSKIIFPKELVESVRCVNIHPGFNPYNRGMFPHVFSIINGFPAGVTIHEMDEKIDHGKILARASVPISENDTSESLYKKIIDAEVMLLNTNMDDIVNNRLKSFVTHGPSNYNSLKDYKKLCQIDPGQTGTFKEFYNLLRALSHGEHKNAILNGHHLKLTIS